MHVYMNGPPTLPGLRNLEVACCTLAGLSLYEVKQTESGSQNIVPGTYHQPGGRLDIARELGHRLQLGLPWVSMICGCIGLHITPYAAMPVVSYYVASR